MSESMPVVVNDPAYWGGCPSCGKNDGFYHRGKEHWCACHEHRVCWCSGYGLITTAEHMDPAEVEAMLATIEGYRIVEPVYRVAG